ncbi:DUF4190 domain-containing protein [Kribbella sp. CA-294648]|uniref:DUF4190 domain-containing protein n=1 Tax=Kribbella sp. CA-294648 TaxID=3239948 RepID=UPI003D8A4598
MSFDERRPQDSVPQYVDRPQDQPHGQQSPAPTQYPLQPGYVYPQPAYGVLRDNSNATLAMVLGLVGLFTMFVVISPIAWWKAQQALGEIDEAPGVYSNRGMAIAGQVTGIIGTIVLGLGVLVASSFLLIFLVALART